MRTAILTGLFYVGDALGSPEYKDSSALTVVIIIFLCCVVADVLEFIKGWLKE